MMAPHRTAEQYLYQQERQGPQQRRPQLKCEAPTQARPCRLAYNLPQLIDLGHELAKRRRQVVDDDCETVRSLACDDPLAVSGPVGVRYARLGADALVAATFEDYLLQARDGPEARKT